MPEFERDLLIERTQSGIIRAKAAGKQFGRPPILNAEEHELVMKQLANGVSIAELARHFKTTRQTILRIKDKFLKTEPDNEMSHKNTTIPYLISQKKFVF